jgi:molecular chaperone DnaJ
MALTCTAALGCTLRVPTLEEDGYHELQVPAGAQFGDIHKLEGLGVTKLMQGKMRRTGNLLVHLMVMTPQNLSAREKELLTELANLRGIELDLSSPPPETITREKLDLIEGE